MKNPTLFQNKTKLWISCLSLSLVAHVTIGSYLYFHPFILQNPLSSLFGWTIAEPKLLDDAEDLDVLTKNLLLEEVFKTIVINPDKLHPPYDLQEGYQLTTTQPSIEKIPSSLLDPEGSNNFATLIDQKTLKQEMIVKEAQEISPSPLFQALEEKAREVSYLQIDESLNRITPSFEEVGNDPYEEILTLNILPTAPRLETMTQEGLSLYEIEGMSEKDSAELKTAISAQITSEEITPSLFTPKFPSTPAMTRQIEVQSSSTLLEEYNPPKLNPSALWNDDFTAEISFAPNPDKEGYLFSVALSPNHDLSAHKLKQNFYFLLDRSASSQRHRFPVFKKAVLKALTSLSAEDSFNIIVLDKTLTAMHNECLSASLKNKRLAEEFLEKQTSSRLFNTGNVYKTLLQVLPNIRNDREAHTAILLTDGLIDSPPLKKRNRLNKWIEENEGKLTLHTAAVGRDNDLLTLDILSSQSGGKLLYSDTHASFPRKLAKLVLDLKNPIAKDITISARVKDGNNAIQLYPISFTLPLLYGDKPYIILGEIDHPANFDISLQARHDNEWIGINKSISFTNARKAESASIRNWKKTQATRHYDNFLDKGKVVHLESAKELLNGTQREMHFQ